MLEIEAKIKVSDLEPTRHALRELHGTCIGTYLETNTFFDTADRSLRSADSGLRLRRKRDLSHQTEQLIVTFKGPRLPGPVKQREERELIVASEPDAVALLESLGFFPVLQFEKRRESWKFQRCQIELDELPEAGFFIEIEGPDEAEVLRVRQLLRLESNALVRESYPEIVDRLRHSI